MTLAGCVTAAHNVDVDDIKNIRIERVDLSLDPAVTIGWYDAQKDYAESRNQQGDTQATADYGGRQTFEMGFAGYFSADPIGRMLAQLQDPLPHWLLKTAPVIERGPA